MKENYKRAGMFITEFSSQDVIATSGESNSPTPPSDKFMLNVRRAWNGAKPPGSNQ